MAGETPRRVAVVGASGIGKHHGKWWALEGAEVCAFVGNSETSVAKTRAVLEDLFGFQGRAYTSLRAMLEGETPDIVDVCSPARCHYGHAKAALEAGCDVLCEKPFVYDRDLPNEKLLAQAEELAALAASTGTLLGLCTQYVVGARIFLDLWNQARPGKAITQYHGHLESPSRGRPPEPERIWMDLAPHVVSVLQGIAPEATVQWDSVETQFSGYEALATFEAARPSGPSLECTLVARSAVDPPRNVRHFKFNGYKFAVEGHQGEDGVYGARIETPDGFHIRPDMMRLLIGEFLDGKVAADARMGTVNLAWLLRMMDVARGPCAQGI